MSTWREGEIVVPPFNEPSWKHLVAKIASDAKLASAAADPEIAGVERVLKISLPPELRDLLTEFNGMTADHGADVIWSASDIQRRNLEFRETENFRALYMPFDHLLFFGDDGGGDQFAFPIQADGRIHNPDIFRWEHETDARCWFAARLEDFFVRRLTPPR